MNNMTKIYCDKCRAKGLIPINPPKETLGPDDFIFEYCPICQGKGYTEQDETIKTIDEQDPFIKQCPVCGKKTTVTMPMDDPICDQCKNTNIDYDKYYFKQKCRRCNQKVTFKSGAEFGPKNNPYVEHLVCQMSNMNPEKYKKLKEKHRPHKDKTQMIYFTGSKNSLIPSGPIEKYKNVDFFKIVNQLPIIAGPTWNSFQWEDDPIIYSPIDIRQDEKGERYIITAIAEKGQTDQPAIIYQSDNIKGYTTTAVAISFKNIIKYGAENFINKLTKNMYQDGRKTATLTEFLVDTTRIFFEKNFVIKEYIPCPKVKKIDD